MDGWAAIEVPPVAPRSMTIGPLDAPPTQKLLPDSVAAVRTFAPLKAALMRVDVSTDSPRFTRPTMRFTVTLDVDAMSAVPGAASYPASTRNRPSSVLESAPSEVAVPESVSRAFAVVPVVGREIGLKYIGTSIPSLTNRSSMTTGVAAGERGRTPWWG